MKKYKILFLCWGLLCFIPSFAKDYNASIFGIKSNGTTLNTTAIQKAVDLISAEGGGKLIFSVGRYLTGTIMMKSNVTIHLKEGAILVGSSNPYDYNIDSRRSASLIYGEDLNNIAINGEGVIDVGGRDLAYNLLDQVHKGVLKDDLKNDRPTNRRPKAIYLYKCNNIKIKHITIKNSADWVQFYDHCENLHIDSIMVDSKAYWNNDGIDIGDCKHVFLGNSFIDATDDGICLKSHDHNDMCEDIEIRNCVVRSSANGIKFGTVSAGGYKNIRIINNKVYDTFRSALTIATPDGADIENILVDSLQAYNTGNAIYLRIGNRWTKDNKIGTMNNITIKNMYVEIPAGKPDAGYEYEGPTEDNPRNISPASIIGLNGHEITNVTLKNIEIVYPGGGNPKYAYRGLTPTELDSIPEMEKKYPEFSQFKELPAWGFYIRHAKGITFDNVTLKAAKKDYRPAIVVQQSENINLKKVKYKEPGGHKNEIFVYKSKNVKK